MPDGWELVPGGQWQRSFVLAEQEMLEESIVVSLFDAGELEVDFEVRYKQGEDHLVYQTLSEILHVQPEPTLTDIQSELTNLRLSQPRKAYVVLAKAQIDAAKTALNNNDAALAQSHIETAIQWLQQSTHSVDELRIALAQRYLKLVRQGH